MFSSIRKFCNFTVYFNVEIRLGFIGVSFDLVVFLLYIIRAVARQRSSTATGLVMCVCVLVPACLCAYGIQS